MLKILLHWPLRILNGWLIPCRHNPFCSFIIRLVFDVMEYLGIHTVGHHELNPPTFFHVFFCVHHVAPYKHGFPVFSQSVHKYLYIYRNSYIHIETYSVCWLYIMHYCVGLSRKSTKTPTGYRSIYIPQKKAPSFSEVVEDFPVEAVQHGHLMGEKSFFC